MAASNPIFNIFEDDKENGVILARKQDKTQVFGNENDKVNRAKLSTITNVQKNDENANDKFVSIFFLFALLFFTILQFSRFFLFIL